MVRVKTVLVNNVRVSVAFRRTKRRDISQTDEIKSRISRGGVITIVDVGQYWLYIYVHVDTFHYS